MEKIGRNDLCPCGSGKKYKQCCQQREVSNLTPQPQPASNAGAQVETVTLAQMRELETLFNAGRYADMERIADALRERHPHSGLAWKALGTALRAQGKDALHALQKAAQLLPADAEIFNNLGSTLLGHGQASDAVAALRHALALKPDSAATHSNLGNALRDLDQLDQAIESYRRALKITPDFAAARGNLGIALSKQGETVEASRSLDTAIALKPDFIDAHYAFSQLKTYRESDPHVAMLEGLAERIARQPMGMRIRYWFTLGKVHEDLGRYDESFAAYREGNRLQDALLAPNEAGEEAQLDRIMSVFTQDFFAERLSTGYASRTPIFIVGMPRSGTTLLEQILASYPGIYGAGELADMSEVVKASFGGPAAKPFPYAVPDLSGEDLTRMGERYAERIWRHAPDAAHITDKMPANFFYVGLIRLMLPNAKIIHAMRDPMDTCFSCYSRLFVNDNQSFAYDQERLGRYYARYAALMQHWRTVLPARAMLDLRYEDMVTDTEGQARRLLEYLELPWDDRCLDFHQNKRRVDTASAAQVRRPIYQTSLARWKPYAQHLSPLFHLVKDFRA